MFASDRHFVNELSYSDTSIYPGTSLARAERIVARNDDWTDVRRPERKRLVASVLASVRLR